MSGPRSLRLLELTAEDRTAFEVLTRRTTATMGLVRRARIVLLAATGVPLDRIARELPEEAGRSLSQWDCAELARQLVRDEVVASISPQTVQRMLAANRLKPWRSHVWLHPRTPRDATFAAQVRAVADLLTRLLDEYEVVLSLDEMTSLQPRPRP